MTHGRFSLVADDRNRQHYRADANAALQKLKKKEQVATKTLLNVSNS